MYSYILIFFKNQVQWGHKVNIAFSNLTLLFMFPEHNIPCVGLLAEWSTSTGHRCSALASSCRILIPSSMPCFDFDFNFWSYLTLPTPPLPPIVVESFILDRRDNSAVLVWRSRLPLSESEDEAPEREIFISGVGRGSCLVNQEQPFFLPCFVFLGSGITFMCLSHHHHRLIFVYARGESLVFFSVEKKLARGWRWKE